MGNKNIVILMGGPPGSGKSTLSQKIIELFPDKNFVLLNIDKISTAKDTFHKWEDLRKEFKNNLKKNRNIILDATFRDKQTRREFEEYANFYNVKLIKVYFILPQETVLNRARQRTLVDIDHPVKEQGSEEIIRKWYKSFFNANNSDLYHGSYFLIRTLKDIDSLSRNFPL